MAIENPTGSESAGASITDRLEAMLTADAAPVQPKAQEAVPAASAPAPEPAPAVEGNDDPEGDDTVDASGPQISTSDIARVFGIDEAALDVDADGNAIVKTKIDGVEGTAKFADVLKSYQLQGHVDNKARAIAEQERQLQQQAQQGDQAIRQRLDHLDGVLGMAERELTAQYQSVDWQTLRVTDPGEYSAALADFQARNAQIQQAKAQAGQQRGQLDAQQLQAKQQREYQEFQRIPDVIPEWRDPAVMEREKAEVLAWGAKRGLNKDSLHTAEDVMLWRIGMQHDRIQAAKPAIEAKVRAAPKLVKSGTPADASREQNNIRALKSQVIKSGGKGGSVAAYLLAAGKV